MAISLISEPEEILARAKGLKEWKVITLSQILEEGRTRGDSQAGNKQAVSSLMLFATGLVVDSRLNDCDIQKEINMFLDMLLASNEKEL